MGSLNGRIKRLEGRVPSILREAEEEERERLARAITRMILDEFARLKASDRSPGEQGDLLERATRRVASDQYEDLGPENCRDIADGWTETLRNWTRLDWMTNARREGPPT